MMSLGSYLIYSFRFYAVVCLPSTAVSNQKEDIAQALAKHYLYYGAVKAGFKGTGGT